MRSLLLSSGSWCTQDFVCALQDWSLFPPVIWKFCNQIPLSFKVSFPRDSQSILWILRLGNLTWGSEPPQQWQNFFGIIVLQSMGHPPDGCGIWFYPGCTSPTISLQHLLCFQMWGIFFLGGFQHPPSFPCGSAGKESACNAEDLGLIPGLEDPLGKGKATHSGILAWRIPLDCIVQGSQRVDTTVTFIFTVSILLSMVLQQPVAISMFSQEKMNVCPSTLPSWIGSLYFFIEPVCALIYNEMKILICKMGNDSTYITGFFFF